MSYGDTPFDAELKRAWEEFCDRIKSASSIVFRDTAPPDPAGSRHRHPIPVALHFKGAEPTVGVRRPALPAVLAVANADQQILRRQSRLHLPGRADRLRTQLPDRRQSRQRFVGLFHLFAALPRALRCRRSTTRDLKTQWDGSFRNHRQPARTAAGEELAQERPWSSSVIRSRNFSANGTPKSPMTIRVERIGQEEEGPPAPLTPQRLIRGLKETADWMIEDATRWVDWVDHYRDIAQPLRSHDARVGRRRRTGGAGPDAAILPLAHPARRGAADRGHAPAMLLLELRAGELLVEFSGLPLPALLFKRQASGVGRRRFGAHRRIARGSGDSKLARYRRPLRRDGESALGGVGGFPTPSATLVKVADLSRMLPSNARRISNAQRKDQLRRRKIGVDRRFPV